ncbi:MAG: hypothetical protein AAB597_01690 [Patescibacteria group bacterium]
MNLSYRKPLLLSAVALLILVVGVLAYGVYSAQLETRITECEVAGDRKEQCFQELILEQTALRGVSAGLDLAAILYGRNPAFAESCHGNMHEIGAEAYRQFSTQGRFDLSPKTSYCGFGFYHGFMESLLAERGDFSEAVRFCSYVDEELSGTAEGVPFACYHGIGHGAVDGSDPAAWDDAQKYIAPALAICEKLGTEDQYKERCGSGVFNALAVAYVNPKYRLGANPADPFAICRMQETDYFRRACYDQMNTYVVKTSATFLEAVDKAVTTSDSRYTIFALRGVGWYAGYQILSAKEDPVFYLEDCNLIRGDLRETCVESVATGLIEFGKPGEEYTLALEACRRSPAPTVSACFRGVELSARDRLDFRGRERVCADIEAVARGGVEGQKCRALMERDF